MYLRWSLTDRCNLRCTYCLPVGARFSADLASSDEQRRLVSLIHRAVGLRKIRLTGGEPTLSDDLLDQARHASRMVRDVGITSNGLLLAPLIGNLRDAGVSRINISLDGHDAQSYHRVRRRDAFARVITSVRAARDSGVRTKVNVVALRGMDFAALAALALREGVHLRFIELMAIGEAIPWQVEAWVGAGEIRAALYEAGWSLIASPEDDEATSRVWRIPGHDPARVSVGFVTTGSEPFCGRCDRLRLSARGRLHTCLFDAVGTDLLRYLRAGDDAAVMAAVHAAVARKTPPEAFRRDEAMANIGG